MIKNQYFFSDMGRMVSGLVGTMAGIRSEVETRMKTCVEQTMNKMDMVPRKDFEEVRLMAETARQETDSLKKRLEKLESDND